MDPIWSFYMHLTDRVTHICVSNLGHQILVIAIECGPAFKPNESNDMDLSRHFHADSFCIEYFIVFTEYRF